MLKYLSLLFPAILLKYEKARKSCHKLVLQERGVIVQKQKSFHFDFVMQVLGVLRNMYGVANVPEPTDFYMSRFCTDPELYGTFPTWPIGCTPKDAQTRLKAHFDRVYFAPEGASTKYIGIPYGSVVGGKDAATRVARCRIDGECGEYSPVEPEAPPLCRDVKPYNPNKRRKNH